MVKFMESDVLNLNISIKDSKYISNVYDKQDKFEFLFVRFTPRFSIVLLFHK